MNCFKVSIPTPLELSFPPNTFFVGKGENKNIEEKHEHVLENKNKSKQKQHFISYRYSWKIPKRKYDINFIEVA